MYEFVVHGAHLMQFARAIGDTASAFEDVDLIDRTGTGALVAPPTFLMAADHFDPEYARRPRPGVPWLGAQPRGREQPSGFHLEQHFTFHRPIRAGDRLVADSRPGASWEKSGRRAGTMTFTEILTDYRDSDGATVATARWVSAMVERKPTLPSLPTAPVAATLHRGGESTSGADGFAVGSVWATRLVEDLSRAQLVMYAGASGDFHPLHSDDVYARDRGYPGVFAHGMLTMGMTGRAITDRVGHANVLSFGGRILSQVWPGDTLTARTEVTGLREDDERAAVADLAVVTVNQSGARVFSGVAVVGIEGLRDS
ncbi:FAS1-like dehydratase domain-containing protein [Rhodococcus sp. SGAir0479]|uniref:FAS1-like dehydratase domain-containing protein n=1 Tax=Rhodococcus sp. SGAir0479 TaxID=2567884 RepID=UPI0010CCBF34|nr:MaoC family dehydratase N-terminal domain-containing protein [Rhodococcus sp. SGAir0479]QCQ90004.1 hypothetical protein E7742_01465 [Rhodococcus sp. SGAir0479]